MPIFINISVMAVGMGTFFVGILKSDENVTGGVILLILSVVILVLGWVLWAFTGIVKDIAATSSSTEEKIKQLSLILEQIRSLLKMMPGVPQKSPVL